MFADTQTTLVCADAVVDAWTRGMQRLLLGGMLRREECEVSLKVSLQQLASFIVGGMIVTTPKGPS